MKYSARFLLIGLIIMAITMSVGVASAQGDGVAVSVTCDNGGSFNNGVEFVVNQMRPGFSYTATAIGIDGFDPVLAVLDNSGNGLCDDDTREAAVYSANLPSSGRVNSSNLSSQVRFSQNAGQMADVSLVVGGFGDADGEFILILEGMAATSADGAGDPFSVLLTPGMVNSGVPLTAYMIAVTDVLDPYMYVPDANYNIFNDPDGNPIYCDDAGSALCYAGSSSLVGSSVSRTSNRTLGGGQYDAMIQIPLQDYDIDFSSSDIYTTFLMTSFEQSSFGDYVVAFHAGTSAEAPDGGKEPLLGAEPTRAPARPTDVPAAQGAPGGISVTCNNGGSFDNGVKFVVNQMRSGFSYTATAIGINGFDPVLAVLDNSGNGLCDDDTREAAVYTANLPSTGPLAASGLSSQVRFSQNAGQMADVSLVVGGFGNASGEFLLILEGMAATSADGAGDPFSVQLTPGLTSGDVPLTVYMIAVTGSLDPYLYMADQNFNIVSDDAGNPIYCDDAGSDLCYTGSNSLVGSVVSRTSNRTLGGGQYDAMLQIPVNEFSSLDFDDGPWFLTFVMTSFEQSTFGDYVIAFHAEAR